MKRNSITQYGYCFTAVSLLITTGCAISLPKPRHPQTFVANQTVMLLSVKGDQPVQTGLAESANSDEPDSKTDATKPKPDSALPVISELGQMEQLSLKHNNQLQQLHLEFSAATARARYVDELPDPKIRANFFGQPIETASGSQRASLSLSQVVPWVEKLDAQQQRATLEALAIQADYQAARLKILSQIRTGWFRLYLIQQQLSVTKSNQQLLQSLIDVANARISAGLGSPGDVLLGTLELSQLEERLSRFRQQRTSVVAGLNKLMDRKIDADIKGPTELTVVLPSQSQDDLLQAAIQSQPDIQAARLRNQAKQWGMEITKLSRRPELTVSASYFFTDDNRASSPVVHIGEDPWFFGIQMSLPIWDKKYDAMQDEARHAHDAAEYSINNITNQYKTMIVQTMAEARRASETATLYKETIIPQAQQTLETDQAAYANGGVEFDRVIRDYRNLLTLELGYHQAISDLAVALAKLQQTVGDSTLLLQQP